MKEKYLIISDIHGSPTPLESVLSYYKREGLNKIFILGDLFYSGARNVPPIDYAPKKVVEILNSYSKDIISIKGNCESDVDLMVAKFPIFEIYSTTLFEKKVALFHGHQNYKDFLSKNNDIVFSGHTHISNLFKEGNTIFANPGSLSLPKDEHHSFIVFEKDKLSIVDLKTFNSFKELKI